LLSVCSDHATQMMKAQLFVRKDRAFS